MAVASDLLSGTLENKPFTARGLEGEVRRDSPIGSRRRWPVDVSQPGNDDGNAELNGKRGADGLGRSLRLGIGRARTQRVDDSVGVLAERSGVGSNAVDLAGRDVKHTATGAVSRTVQNVTDAVDVREDRSRGILHVKLRRGIARRMDDCREGRLDRRERPRGVVVQELKTIRCPKASQETRVRTPGGDDRQRDAPKGADGKQKIDKSRSDQPRRAGNQYGFSGTAADFLCLAGEGTPEPYRQCMDEIYSAVLLWIPVEHRNQLL